jgi:hypothetical protein
MLEKNAKLGASGFVLLTKHFSGDQSQRMSWAGHVEHMTREKRTRFWFGNLKKQGGKVWKG